MAFRRRVLHRSPPPISHLLCCRIATLDFLCRDGGSYRCRNPSRRGAWMMFPFPGSQATALSQAVALKHAMPKPVKTGSSNADASPPVPTVRKGLFRRVLDILVESRRRKADREIGTHRRWMGVDE